MFEGLIVPQGHFSLQFSPVLEDTLSLSPLLEDRSDQNYNPIARSANIIRDSGFRFGSKTDWTWTDSEKGINDDNSVVKDSGRQNWATEKIMCETRFGQLCGTGANPVSNGMSDYARAALMVMYGCREVKRTEEIEDGRTVYQRSVGKYKTVLKIKKQ